MGLEEIILSCDSVLSHMEAWAHKQLDEDQKAIDAVVADSVFGELTGRLRGFKDYVWEASVKNPNVAGMLGGLAISGALFLGWTGSNYIGGLIDPIIGELNDLRFKAVSSLVMGYPPFFYFIRYYCIRERNFIESGIDMEVWNEFEKRFSKFKRPASGFLGYLGKHKLGFSLAFNAGINFFVSAGLFVSNLMIDYSYGMKLNVDLWLNHSLRLFLYSSSNSLPIFTLALYSILRIANMDISVSNFRSFLESGPSVFLAKITGDYSSVVDAMSHELRVRPSKNVRYTLANAYFRSGRFDDGMIALKGVFDHDEPLGLEGISMVNQVKTDISWFIKSNGTEADFMMLAGGCYLIGDKARGERAIDEMVENSSSAVDSHMLAFRFHHGNGDSLAMRRHLAEGLSLALENPRYRMEPLGEDATNAVYGFDSSFLKDMTVVKFGSDENSLVFDMNWANDIRNRILYGHPYRSACEPFLVDTVQINGRQIPIYAMARLKGETLYRLLKTGRAGFQDVVSAWDLRKTIYDNTDKSISEKGYTPPSKKLESIVQALIMDDSVRPLLMLFAEPIGHYSGNPDDNPDDFVVSMDATPKNLMRNGLKEQIFDLADKGVVHIGYEAVACFRYVPVFLLKEREAEFLKIAGIDPVAYYHQAVLKDLSLAAWAKGFNPAFAVERLEDAVYAVAQIKDFQPLSYHRFDYASGVRGIEKVIEMIAA